MAVFDAARKIMADSGNTNQWKNGYPSEEIVFSDMEKNGGFVIEDGGQIVGYFAFLPSPEPTRIQPATAICICLPITNFFVISKIRT